MMRVLFIQHNDGVQSGGVGAVEPAFEGDTAKDLLHRKAQSHARHGWFIAWQGEDRFHAWKTYDLPGYPRRKDRWFWIAEE